MRVLAGGSAMNLLERVSKFMQSLGAANSEEGCALLAELAEAGQAQSEAHARAILDAKTDDWFWIEAGEKVAHLDGMFTLDQVEAIATCMRLGKGYKAKWV